MQRCLAVVALIIAGAVRADEPRERVEDYAARAYELVNKGQYNDAIALYLRGYQLTPTSALLFNIASIYDKRLQERELAADYYRRYLRAVDADPELAKKASARLEAIKDELARAAQNRAVTVLPDPKSAPLVSPPPSAPLQVQEPASKAAPFPTSRVAGIVVGAAGLAAVGVGLGFGASAKSLNEKALTFCRGKTCWDQRGVDLTNQAKSAAMVATVSVAAGAAAFAAGLVLAIVAPGSPTSGAVAWRVGPTVTPTSAGVFVAGEL